MVKKRGSYESLNSKPNKLVTFSTETVTMKVLSSDTMALETTTRGGVAPRAAGVKDPSSDSISTSARVRVFTEIPPCDNFLRAYHHDYYAPGY